VSYAEESKRIGEVLEKAQLTLDNGARVDILEDLILINKGTISVDKTTIINVKGCIQNDKDIILNATQKNNEKIIPDTINNFTSCIINNSIPQINLILDNGKNPENPLSGEIKICYDSNNQDNQLVINSMEVKENGNQKLTTQKLTAEEKNSKQTQNTIVSNQNGNTRPNLVIYIEKSTIDGTLCLDGDGDIVFGTPSN